MKLKGGILSSSTNWFRPGSELLFNYLLPRTKYQSTMYLSVFESRSAFI